jgi:hypothetical protein
VREMESLKTENKTLRDDIRPKSTVMKRYEANLKKYRSQSFLNEDYAGMRRYNKEIVGLLKSSNHIDGYRLLEELGIDPGESDLVKAISNQLEDGTAFIPQLGIRFLFVPD